MIGRESDVRRGSRGGTFRRRIGKSTGEEEGRGKRAGDQDTI